MARDACVTETGRVIDVAPMEFGGSPLELVRGAWVTARSPLSADELYNATVLSEGELRSYIEKTGKSVEVLP